MEFEKFREIHVSDNRINMLPSFIRKYFDADSYSELGNKFCVADGVTRDLKNGDEFKFTKVPKELLKTLRYFPEVLKLKKVSDLCTNIFTSTNISDLNFLLTKINQKIFEYNVNNLGDKVDFLGKNLFGVTAAGGIIEDNHLKCFNVADSNIMVLDKFSYIISKTYDDFTSKSFDRDKSMREVFPNSSWSDNEYRSFFRSVYRNTDAVNSFGTLTGEPKALEHVHYYDFDLKDAVYIYAYTDGFIDVMDSLSGRQNLMYGRKLTLSKEASIIGYRKRK